MRWHQGPQCASVAVVGADLATDAGCVSLRRDRQALSPMDVLVNKCGGMIVRQPVEELAWRNLLDTFALNTFSISVSLGCASSSLSSATTRAS